jgi:flagellar biogenesis protein FliO
VRFGFEFILSGGRAASAVEGSSRKVGERRLRRNAFGLIILSLALLSSSAFAQATKPAAASFEDEPLRVSDTRHPVNLQSPGEVKGPAPIATPDIQRVGLALAIVIGAIFILRGIARKLFLLPTGSARGNKGIKVLSRSVLAPKQQLLLLQVGKRVIVVGDSAGHMSALCEISEADEVAALVGELTQDQSAPPKKSFGNLFGLAKEPFNAAADVEAADANVEPVTELGLSDHADIGGLMEKIRGMQRQFKK